MWIKSRTSPVVLNNEAGVQEFGSEPVEVTEILGRALLTNYPDLVETDEPAPDEKPFPCDVEGCDWAGKTETALKAHKTRAHKRSKSWLAR